MILKIFPNLEKSPNICCNFMRAAPGYALITSKLHCLSLNRVFWWLQYRILTLRLSLSHYLHSSPKSLLWIYQVKSSFFLQSKTCHSFKYIWVRFDDGRPWVNPWKLHFQKAIDLHTCGLQDHLVSKLATIDYYLHIYSCKSLKASFPSPSICKHLDLNKKHSGFVLADKFIAAVRSPIASLKLWIQARSIPLM